MCKILHACLNRGSLRAIHSRHPEISTGQGQSCMSLPSPVAQEAALQSRVSAMQTNGQLLFTFGKVFQRDQWEVTSYESITLVIFHDLAYVFVSVFCEYMHVCVHMCICVHMEARAQLQVFFLSSLRLDPGLAKWVRLSHRNPSDSPVSTSPVLCLFEFRDLSSGTHAGTASPSVTSLYVLGEFLEWPIVFQNIQWHSLSFLNCLYTLLILHKGCFISSDQDLPMSSSLQRSPILFYACTHSSPLQYSSRKWGHTVFVSLCLTSLSWSLLDSFLLLQVLILPPLRLTVTPLYK